MVWKDCNVRDATAMYVYLDPIPTIRLRACIAQTREVLLDPLQLGGARRYSKLAGCRHLLHDVLSFTRSISRDSMLQLLFSLLLLLLGLGRLPEFVRSQHVQSAKEHLYLPSIQLRSWLWLPFLIRNLDGQAWREATSNSQRDLAVLRLDGDHCPSLVFLSSRPLWTLFRGRSLLDCSLLCVFRSLPTARLQEMLRVECVAVLGGEYAAHHAQVLNPLE